MSVSVFKRLRGTIQGLGQQVKLLRDEDGVLAVDGFVDSWNDYGRVACELTWSEDRVLIPGTVGQTFGRQ